MNIPTLARTVGGAIAALACGMAHADAVPVPYNGSYDERVSAPAGDYDAIGGLADVGEFTLLAGSNTFLGGVKTPDDSSDVFLVRIGAGMKLVGASIQWATNANDFNPVFAAPGPVWTLEESDADPTIFLLALGGNGATSPLQFTAPSFERGAGSYSVLIGNGTFAMNNSDPVAYRMNFDVVAAPVPEPASYALMAVGLLLCGAAVRARRAS